MGFIFSGTPCRLILLSIISFTMQVVRQRRMILVVNDFDFLVFEIIIYCFVFAIIELEYNVEAINDLCSLLTESFTFFF